MLLLQGKEKILRKVFLLSKGAGTYMPLGNITVRFISEALLFFGWIYDETTRFIESHLIQRK